MKGPREKGVEREDKHAQTFFTLTAVTCAVSPGQTGQVPGGTRGRRCSTALCGGKDWGAMFAEYGR